MYCFFQVESHLLQYWKLTTANLFFDEVFVHLSESSVGSAMHWPTVDVIAKLVVLEQEDTDVWKWTKVDKLLDSVLEKPLVDKCKEENLGCSYRPRDTVIKRLT